MYICQYNHWWATLWHFCWINTACEGHHCANDTIYWSLLSHCRETERPGPCRIRSSPLAHSLLLTWKSQWNTKQHPVMWPFNRTLPCLTSMKRATSPSMAARAISAQLRQEETSGHMGAQLWSALSLPRGRPGVTALNTLTVLPGQGRRKERRHDGLKKLQERI